MLGWFALGCLLATAILALALVLPAWLAALTVTVVVGIAALVGKRKVAEAAPPVPTDTVESVKKDVAEIKESARR